MQMIVIKMWTNFPTIQCLIFIGWLLHLIFIYLTGSIWCHSVLSSNPKPSFLYYCTFLCQQNKKLSRMNMKLKSWFWKPCIVPRKVFRWINRWNEIDFIGSSYNFMFTYTRYSENIISRTSKILHNLNHIWQK